MCKFLMRVQDQRGDNDFFTLRLTQAGDMIVCVPDFWQFTQRELNNPEWRILHVTDMSWEEGQQYVALERDANNKRTGRKKDIQVQLNLLPRRVYTALQNSLGTEFRINRADLDTVRRSKPAIDRPVRL